MATMILFSQDPLPRGLGDGEELLIESYKEYLERQVAKRSINQNPPVSPTRTMAEWEELDALAITWTGFPSILAEIVRNGKEECEIIIVCSDSFNVQTYLTNWGIDHGTNVSFIETSFNSIWIRDYGPNSVYTNDVDSLLIIDWIYNRPRALDDQVPEAIANFLDIPIHSTISPPNDLVHTGGNFMADGMGTGFSSKLVLDENDITNNWGTSNHSESDVDRIMDDYMGIDEYIKMEVLPYDLIHHIDMHMKLLDETRLLVGEYPPGIADGPQIEANIQYILSQFQNPFGEPYDIIRIPMPPDFNGRYPNQNGDYRTYANAIFINKTILVPTYEERYDTTALRIWRENMPGYNVVGIDCNSIIPLSGALHCITKEIGTKDPLLITHNPHKDVRIEIPSGYPIAATIKHRSGIESATLFYTADIDQGFQSLELTLTDSLNDLWTAIIPAQADGSVVSYYIASKAKSGKEQVRPLTAPEGHWSFRIDYPTANINLESNSTLFGKIYPNPSSGITVIPITTLSSETIQLQLIDQTGRLIETIFEGTTTSGENQYFINSKDYSEGIYFVLLTSNSARTVQKLVVKGL